MCHVPSITVFCSESIECFPSTAPKFFLLLLLLLLLMASAHPYFLGTTFHLTPACHGSSPLSINI
jgi:hypothetical protein